ncbi:hypothetical protein IJ847_02925 [Candidatus Saccharibacteria bacterium]|nr:hypothetical protein [Candidatus Saccharibacteria bacterium]
MDKKDAQQIKSNYCIAATVAGVIAMALYFTSQFLVAGKILVALAILFAICFIVFMIKAFTIKIDKSAKNTKAGIAGTSKSKGKVGMIISGIVLALSILAPVITATIISIRCDARGATNESTCPEMWAVMIVMFFSVPCASASGLYLLIAAINYFTNKKKLKKSA